MMNFKIHSLADLYPPMITEEYDALKADIAANGLQTPIALYWVDKDSQYKVLDGRHRQRACRETDIDARFEWLSTDIDPLQYVISANGHRRQLTPSQRAAVAADVANVRHGGLRVKLSVDNLGVGDTRSLFEAEPYEVPAITIAAAAALTGAAEGSVNRASAVKHANPDLHEAVKAGTVSVADAYSVRDEPAEVVTAALETLASGNAPKEQHTLRRVINGMDREKRRRETKKSLPPLPVGKYRTLVVDPPWPMKKSERTVPPERVGVDYPTMSLDEIHDLGVPGLLADDALAFLWTTQEFLPECYRLFRKWQIKYRFTMTWHKSDGVTASNGPRYNSEFVVVGAVGNPEFLDTTGFDTANSWPNGEASAKPREFYDLLRRVCAAPRLDMFARQERDGFDVWGEAVQNNSDSESGLLAEPAR